MSSLVIDSSAWIDYFEGYGEVKDYIEKSKLKTPTIAIAEIVRVLEKKGKSKEKIMESVGYIKDISAIPELDFQHAISGAYLCRSENLDFADALIYSYATKEEPLLTTDLDFKDKENAIYIAIRKKK